MAGSLQSPKAILRRRKTLLLIVNILVISSLACTGLSFGAEKPSLTEEIATKAEPAALQPQALPPVITEISPIEGSDINYTSGITFFFNQPMNRETVEASIKIEPPLPGRFEWLDENRAAQFVPSEDLPPKTGIVVKIETSAKAANGLALAAPAEFRFRTPDSLQVTERIPALNEFDSSPDSAVMTTFNQPVVPLGAEENTPPAFTLSPEAPGRGEWVNTSTYVFYPDPPLQGGISYRVQMNSALISVSGMPLDPGAAAVEWIFTTAAPRLVSIKPDPNLPLYPDSVFELKFNQPMDRASIEQNLKLASADGAIVNGSFTWSEEDRVVTFAPEALLSHSTEYTLKLASELLGKSGVALSGAQDVIFLTTDPLAVQSTNPKQGELLRYFSGYTSLVINFNNPIKRQKLADFIQIEPAIYQQEIYATSDENVVYISGIYEANTAYTVTISPALQDRWGQPLGKETKLAFRTAPASPALNIPVLQYSTNAVFILPEQPSLKAQATNISSIRVQTGKLDLARFIQLNEQSEFESLPEDAAPLTTSRQQALALPPNRSTFIEIPLTPAGHSLETGLYFINIKTPGVKLENSYYLRPFLGVSSQVHLLMKRSPQQMFIWATNLQTRQPIVGETIALYDNQFNFTGSAVTDEQGIARFPLAGYDGEITYYAVTGEPGQENFGIGLENWNNGIASWDFGLPSYQYNRQDFAYLYTDRPIYQPGQTVNFRVILRQEEYGQYALPGLQSISVNIYGEYSPTAGERPLLTTQSLPLSPYGTASGSFQLPQDAPVGTYSLALKDGQYSQLDFQVAAYRKPEFEILASFEEEDQFTGEDLAANIQANYYFGAPAGNLKVHWILYARPESLSLPDQWVAGKSAFYWSQASFLDYSPFGQVIKEGDIVTQTDGSVRLEFLASDLSNLLTNDQRQILTLEVTGQDESQIPVSARAEMVLHPGKFYIGVKTETWVGKTGSPLGFQIQTIDWKISPSGNHDLRAELQKISWETEDPAGVFSYRDSVKPVFSAISSVKFKTDSQGRSRLEFIPPEPGTYQLEVKGEGALTQVLVWVTGPAGASWPELANQQLSLRSNATEYSGGETARIFIPNPFPGRTIGLITFEKGEILQTSVIEFESASYEFNLPIEAEYAPNGYLSVTLIGATASGQPDFRSGYLEILVKPQTKHLNVEVTPQPAAATPGSEVNLSIRVTDWQGKPVQGEFSVALVDKALLALTDPNAKDILTAFYDHIPLGVSTSFPLAAYSQRAVLFAADGRGGGGMGPLPPVIRSNFQDTAYWNGSVETDTAGSAILTVKLPDNLTTWVVTVRGLTKETLVGEAVREIVTGKDLMLRPVTPRFLVVGDHVALSAIVHNNTPTPLNADVSLQAIGFALDDAGQEIQPIVIPAGDHRQVTWWGTVQDIGNVELVFSAKAGDLQDSARPEVGSLPVLKYSSPQTYASAGILPQEGDRLEVISLPSRYTPVGGALSLELSPSLAAAIISGLEVLKNYPTELTEANLSRLLANVQTYRVLTENGLESPTLRANLESAIQGSLKQILLSQNADGGWGWMAGLESNDYLSAYVVLGLSQVHQAGILINGSAIQKAQEYLIATLEAPETLNHTWQLDRLVFKHYALAQSGLPQSESALLYDARDRLSPWSKALLALLFYRANPADGRASELVSNLKGAALRTSSGAHWEEPAPTQINLTTPNLNTAMVVMALATIDPASDLLNDAVRYLIAHRRAGGGWYSSYDSAWALMALNEVLKGTGELQSSYTFSASLNDKIIAQGQADGVTSLTPVNVETPLADLLPGVPNALRLNRSVGAGRLYYRTALQLHQPVEFVQPVQKGLAIQRSYYLTGENCTAQKCPPIEAYQISEQEPGQTILVKLTLTLGESAYYLVVEDFIPAGTEIVNLGFKTSQLGQQTSLPYDPRRPFESGYGWWFFGHPQIYHDHIRWMAEFMPAGSYELTYRLIPNQPGKYHVLPAHAYAYYFPEFEGSSAGQVFEIR
ncbi:MAG: hypothetical protein HPY59_06925 [Anaerolineae bacterium]|nr:hypothetical protein [Anaerolineae bacterium]